MATKPEPHSDRQVSTWKAEKVPVTSGSSYTGPAQVGAHELLDALAWLVAAGSLPTVDTTAATIDGRVVSLTRVSTLDVVPTVSHVTTFSVDHVVEIRDGGQLRLSDGTSYTVSPPVADAIIELL